MSEANLNEACSDIAAPGSPVVRDYAHSPADCFELIAAMAGKGYSILVTMLYDKPFAKIWSADERYWTASGETFQLAVCRAAVAAMETK